MYSFFVSQSCHKVLLAKNGWEAGVRWGRGQKNLNFGRGYLKKKSREENGMGVGRKKMGGGRGVEHYPPVLPHGANYLILKQ